MEPLSFGQLWPQTVATVRRHLALIWPVAAAFLFLPQLLFSWHVGDATPDDLFRPDRLVGDLLAVALLVSVSLVGQLVIAFIVMHDGTRGRTVGDILKGAVLLLVPALAASLIQGLAVGFGLLFLIIPGLWLLARLVAVVPLLATDVPDPVAALRTSWRLTEGRSLTILGMVAILLLGFLMISIGINGLGLAVGVVSELATSAPDGWQLGRWLFEALAAAASAGLGTFYIAFLTILTRALKATPREEA